MSSSMPNGKHASRGNKPSRTVVLRLRNTLLARFPSDSSVGGPPSPYASAFGTPKAGDDKMSESNGTPVPASAAEDTPAPEGEKKRGPGAKPGVKRNASTAALDLPKPRGRPGPKKKPRLADGTIDRSQDAVKPANAGNSAAAHKLNPKANTGAINANLRALDRTGKPCRKWQRHGLVLKSFTGVNWGVGSWSAPRRASPGFAGDVRSDGSSTGEAKPTMESSNVPSESSRSGDNVVRPLMNGMESSPAPIPA